MTTESKTVHPGKPAPPQVVKVNPSTRGLYLSTSSVERHVRRAASKEETKNIETVITAMKKEAEEAAKVASAAAAASGILHPWRPSELNYETDVYVVDEAFWTWFAAAVKWEQALHDAMRLGNTAIIKYLNENVANNNVPPVTDDVKRADWEVATIVKLERVRMEAIEKEPNKSVRNEVNKMFDEGHVEEALLRVHIQDLPLSDAQESDTTATQSAAGL